MDNKQRKLREPTREELAQMFKEIIQEDRDHAHMLPTRPKCNDCVHRIDRTSKCRLLYPQGIPKEIVTEKTVCKEFKQK